MSMPYNSTLGFVYYVGVSLSKAFHYVSGKVLNNSTACCTNAHQLGAIILMKNLN